MSEKELSINLKSILIEFDDFDIIDEIGEGGFCKVYKGKYKERNVAIKLFDSSHLKDVTEDEDWDGYELIKNKDQLFEVFKWEATSLFALNHYNVIKLIAIAISDKKQAIIMEYCDGGSLQNRIESSPESMDENWIYERALEMAEGLLYLHNHGRVHRDVKPSNVLLTKNDHVKWCDFGVSQLDFTHEEKELWLAKKGVQDIDYSTPEILCARRDRKVAPSNSNTDVYSFGLLCLQLCMKKSELWSDLENDEIESIIVQNKVLEHFSNEFPSSSKLASIIKNCLKSDMNGRPTMANIVKELKSIVSTTFIVKHVSNVYNYPRKCEIERTYIPNLIDNIFDRFGTDDSEKGVAVEEKLQSFIKEDCKESDCSGLVLFGEGGVGKSTALYKLDFDTTGVMIVHIRYGIMAMDQKWSYVNLQDCIATSLEGYGISRNRQQELKEQKLVFVLDGFGELENIHKQKANNVIELIGMEKENWPHAKLIVTCRGSLFDKEEYSVYFNTEMFHLRSVEPFNEEQVDEYISKSQSNKHSNKRRKLDIMDSNFDELKYQTSMSNPLLLQIMLKSSKYINTGYVQHASVKKRDIYEAYITKWLNDLKFQFLKNDNQDLYANYYEFIGKIAMEMFLTDSFVISDERVNSVTNENLWNDWLIQVAKNADIMRQEQKAESNGQQRFIISDRMFKEMRIEEFRTFLNSSIIQKRENNQFMFIHRSFRDFFAANYIMKNSADNRRWQYSFLNCPLSSKLLTQDYEILDWCANYVNRRETSIYKNRYSSIANASEHKSELSSKYLWDILDLCKFSDDLSIDEKKRIEIVGANCLSILNAAGISFCARDLRNIQAGGNFNDHTMEDLPFADMSNSRLYGTDLRGANLQYARLDNSTMDKADLRNCDLTNADFAEEADIRLSYNFFEFQVNRSNIYFSNVNKVYSLSLVDNDAVPKEIFSVKHFAIDLLCVDSSNIFAVCDEIIYHWNFTIKCLLDPLIGHTDTIECIIMSNDGQYVYSGGMDGHIRQWKLNGEINATCTKIFVDDIYTVGCLAISMDDRYLYCGGYDNVIRKFKVSTGECLLRFIGHDDYVMSIVLIETQLFSASVDTTIRCWNVNDGQCLHILNGHTSHVTNIIKSYDSRYIYSYSKDRTTRKWDVKSNYECDIIHKPDTAGGNLCLIPRMDIYNDLICMFDSVACLYGIAVLNAETKKSKRLYVTTDKITNLLTTKTTKQLFVQQNSETIHQIDLLSDEIVRDFNGKCLEISADDQYLFVTNGAKIDMFELETNQYVKTIDTSKLNGRQIIVYDHKYKTSAESVIDLQNNNDISQIVYYENKEQIDEKFLFIASEGDPNHCVWKWNIITGECVAIFKGISNGKVLAVDMDHLNLFSSLDGNRIIKVHNETVDELDLNTSWEDEEFQNDNIQIQKITVAESKVMIDCIDNDNQKISANGYLEGSDLRCVFSDVLVNSSLCTSSYDNDLFALAYPGGIFVGTVRGFVATVMGYIEVLDAQLITQLLLSYDKKELFVVLKSVIIKRLKVDLAFNPKIDQVTRVNSVCVSSNGEYLYCGCPVSTAEIYDAISGEHVKSYFTTDCVDTIVRLSIDDKFLFACGHSHITKWDITTDSCIKSVEYVEEEHKIAKLRLALTFDGKYLFVMKLAGVIYKYNTNLELLSTMRFDHEIHCLAISNDSQQLFCGSGNGEISILNVDGKLITKLNQGSNDAVVSLAYCNNVLFSGHNNGNICKWDISNGQCISKYSKHIFCVFGLTLSPDNKYLYSSDYFGLIYVWEIDKNQFVGASFAHKSLIADTCSFANYSVISASARDIARWDFSNELGGLYNYGKFILGRLVWKTKSIKLSAKDIRINDLKCSNSIRRLLKERRQH